MMTAHPVSFQVEHLLLEHVLHVAASAVKFLIQPTRCEASRVLFIGETIGGEVGYDESWVVAVGGDFSLADGSARASPGLPCLISKLPEYPHSGAAGKAPLCSGSRHGRLKFLN